MNESALIFIPDISGYTEFLTTTEIKHSKHIISELLEIIIAGNHRTSACRNVDYLESSLYLDYLSSHFIN